VDTADLPDAYQGLLAHDDHMPVTVEAFHDSLVDVQVLQQHLDPPYYCRKSLLKRRTDGRSVQLGCIRICLDLLPDAVRTDVLAGNMPLGRILIRHHVLRHVELIQLWQVDPGEELRHHLDLPADTNLYGRTARIIVQDRPAVQLLEIAVP
jgi:chorismate-pyruvate lyase